MLLQTLDRFDGYALGWLVSPVYHADGVTGEALLDHVFEGTTRDEHYLHYTPEGQRTLSTGAFFDRLAGFASGLEKLGIGRGDRVMLLSDNRPEWHLSDLAIVDLGAVDTPVYGTLNPSQVAYQATDSGAKAAVVENPDQMAKFLEVKDSCPDLEHLIQIEGPTAAGVISSSTAPRLWRASTRAWASAAVPAIISLSPGMAWRAVLSTSSRSLSSRKTHSLMSILTRKKSVI